MIEVMEEKGDLEAVLDLVEEGGTEILDEEEYGIYSDYLDLVMGSKDAKDHNANLVDHIDDDTWLSNLGQDVIEWYKQDLQTRKEWEMRERAVSACSESRARLLVVVRLSVHRK
jgi:hypothetical protein